MSETHCTQCQAPVESYTRGPRRRLQHPEWCRRCRQRELSRESNRRYRSTEKYRATRARYIDSETSRATRARYFQSEQGNNMRRMVRIRYGQSEKGRTCRRRGWQSERTRTSKAQWRRSEVGRAIIRARLARRRARMRGATVLERVDRRTIFDLDAGLCHVCDRPVDPRAFHLDHLIPLAVEPIEAAFNSAVTHPACNVWKSNSFDEVVLLPSARARWQVRRPAHLAELDAHVARIVVTRRGEEAAA